MFGNIYSLCDHVDDWYHTHEIGTQENGGKEEIGFRHPVRSGRRGVIR